MTTLEGRRSMTTPDPASTGTADREALAAEPLPPACNDLSCGWASVPHCHEGDEVYPAPPDDPAWLPHLLTGFEAEGHD